MATLEERLDPALVAELRRRLTAAAGLDVPEEATPDAAPPPAPPETIAPPPAPPPEAMDPRAKLYDYLQGRLGPAYGPQAMEEAQRRDDRLNFIRSLGEIGQGTSEALAGTPRRPAEMRNDAVQRLMAQRQDALGALDVSGHLAQFDAQQRMMDPGSPESKQARAMAMSQAPEVVRAIGPGFFQASAAQIQQAVANLKGMGEARKPAFEAGKLGAETEKIGAEIPGVEAETKAKVALQRPMAPEHLAVLAAQGFKLPEGTTYAQAKDLVEQSAKGEGLKIDWAKLALEKYKAGIEGPAQKLRTEFQGLQTYKDMQEVSAAYRKLRSASHDDAGNLSLVYAFIKMNNPNAMVREGQTAKVEEAGGVPAKLLNTYNRLVTGDKLAPQVREEFMQQAHKLYAAQREHYEETASHYRRLASQHNVSPEDVVLDIGLGKTPPPPPPSWRPD